MLVYKVKLTIWPIIFVANLLSQALKTIVKSELNGLLDPSADITSIYTVKYQHENFKHIYTQTSHQITHLWESARETHGSATY